MHLTKSIKTGHFFKLSKSSSSNINSMFEKRLKNAHSKHISFDSSVKALKDKTNHTSKPSINDNNINKSHTRDNEIELEGEVNNGNITVGDFFFLFGREDEIPKEAKLLEETRTNTLINKLGVWDRDNLSSHLNTKDKFRESLMEVETLGISLNKKESVVDVEKLMNEDKAINKSKSSLKIKEPFLNNTIDKQHFRYESKGRFDFTVFFANKSQGNNLNLNNRDNKNSNALPSILMEKKKNNSLDKVELQVNKANYYNQYVREQKKVEINHREKLMDLYQNIVIHKLKKKKYEGILDDIYKLLETARVEFSLSIDILKERIIRNEKFYKKSNESLLKNLHNLPDQIHQKIKKQNFQSSSPLNQVQQVLQSDSNFDDSQGSISNDDKSVHTKTSKANLNNLNNLNNILSSVTLQTNQSSNQNKKKQNLMQEKMRIYKEYLSILEDLQNKINQNNVSFNEVKIELNKMINEIKQSIEENNLIMDKLKLMFQTLTKQQKRYYNTLLLQGNDTRSEGLSWIVKKLIELNASLDSSSFPNYLDQEQIDYLIMKSKLEVESNQLKLVLKTLKLRQQEILNQDKFQRLAQLQSSSFPVNECEIKNKIFETNDILQKKLLDSLNSKFEEILSRHEGILRESTEQKIEECQIRNIIMTIKERLSDYATTNQLFDESEHNNNVERYLDEHKNQKEYFEDIRTIRKRLSVIEDELNKVKRDQIETFRRKFHFIKERQTGKAISYYENVHKALFGSTFV